jgi:phage gpG-like protein
MSDIEGIQEALNNLEKIDNKLFELINKALHEKLSKVEAIMQKKVSGQVLRRRTGELSRSIKSLVVGTNLTNLYGEISISVPYAAIHEYGGTIKAKNAKYLTIPLPSNQTPSGVMKKTARQVIEEGGFTAKSKKGNLLMFGKKGQDIEPLFALKKQVDIPARLGFRETFEDTMQELPAQIRFD